MTECLRIVLDSLQKHSHHAFATVISRLLGAHAPPQHQLAAGRFRTQTSRKLGITDLEFENAFVHLILEAKVGAEKDDDQLLRYRTELDRSPRDKRLLVFLTAAQPELKLPPGVDCWIRWNDVGDALSDALPGIQNEFTKNVVTDFVRFLEERGMVRGKVSDSVGAAMALARDFLQILREAANQANLPKKNDTDYSVSISDGWLGLYVDNGNFWVGTSAQYPDEIRFVLNDGYNNDRKRGRLPEGLVVTGATEQDEFVGGIWRRRLILDESFYSMDRSAQVRFLGEWCKSAWEFAVKLKQSAVSADDSAGT